MNCKVQGVYKNLRYRILIIEEERYILDMGSSFWKILFPFFYWILPNTAYKVKDREIIEKIKTPGVKQSKTAWDGVLAGVVGVILANLLQPLVNYFDVESTPLVNSIIVAITLLIILSVFYYLNIRSKKSLSRVVNLEQYSKKRLWVRPQSFKHFAFISFFYLFFLGFTILSWGGFIQLANAIILFAGMLCLSLAILCIDGSIRRQ
ncbi:DUF443 family protein [Lentibacillus sp. CBA3610]|uniref:DUF443 family protein n=1 Tax=Lentibacillus sp. CBA3610 TaxID=2518176 RepID=UPI0015956FB8|nr:DUF443 family protein [Lentibacillus sp. CBA3610]QKY69798.1 DUF443 family protein [Lentibacillus sp. CBA3610]